MKSKNTGSKAGALLICSIIIFWAVPISYLMCVISCAMAIVAIKDRKNGGEYSVSHAKVTIIISIIKMIIDNILVRYLFSSNFISSITAEQEIMMMHKFNVISIWTVIVIILFSLIVFKNSRKYMIVKEGHTIPAYLVDYKEKELDDRAYDSNGDYRHTGFTSYKVTAYYTYTLNGIKRTRKLKYISGKPGTVSKELPLYVKGNQVAFEMEANNSQIIKDKYAYYATVISYFLAFFLL